MLKRKGKVVKVRKLPKPEPQRKGRDSGNEAFKKLKDTYEPIVVSEKRIQTKDYYDKNMKLCKQYVEVRVQRDDDDDDLGLPYVVVQMYLESERYTGYMKGRYIKFPLEMLDDFMDTLIDVSETCDRKKIE